MAELKTKQTGKSVTEFLNNLADDKKRQDSQTLIQAISQATGAEPRMWGESIIGFGDWRYKYESGRENDWFQVGFSPRKQNLTLYLNCGSEPFADLLARLGKFQARNSCLYINKVEDIDLAVLQELVTQAVERLKTVQAAQ
jgi:hypothetical protein